MQINGVSLDQIVFVDPPALSDGIDGKELAEAYTGASGQVCTDVKDFENARSVFIIGELLNELRHNTTSENACMTRLPNGYAILRTKKQNYVYGHPSKSRYYSVREFLPHLEWLEMCSQRKKAICGCEKCRDYGSTTELLRYVESTTTKEIQRSPKVVVKTTVEEISNKLSWDNVLRVQKIVIAKKHQFPPPLHKTKKKKEDYGSLNDIRPFAVQVPDVLPNPKSDDLLKRHKK